MATILSRSLKRALLDSKLPVPPTFLLPWAAGITTASHSTQTANGAPLAPSTSSSPSPAVAELKPAPKSSSSASSSPSLSSSIQQHLPLLRSQGPHYITAHIYDRPYLLTQGDTVRLPFLMHGVEPGDVLRLDRASVIGSREYTLKAGAAAPPLKSATMGSVSIADPTPGSLASHSQAMPEGDVAAASSNKHAPHFIPHIAKGKVAYLDDRLFVCRAVVMGVESEPMRVMEKTKRRQRKVKHVKSKHRYTILKIKELRVRSLEELESGNLE
ncbi:homocitrate dehydratase, mitochondrial [Acrodontium crateriforme]|uniref:Large ribosomal subunit protein bL21m n=1 Tax=Acrodontium crateriforme TaxID=150365 RepID=A0AAQ3M3D4_9PEZI|nr:homocitrate dehydratase, mitochondrial [Acrodontium crateriforme]